MVDEHTNIYVDMEKVGKTSITDATTLNGPQ